MQNLLLLSEKEFGLRHDRIRRIMTESGIDTLVISDNANIYYLTGRIFYGWVVIRTDAPAMFFVRRPNHLNGDNCHHIRKPEEIPSYLGSAQLRTIAFENDIASYNSIERLKTIFAVEKPANASAVMRMARSVKTDYELELIQRSGIKQTYVYGIIPQLFRYGMTDIEFQIEIERRSRLEGCLGEFRTSGDSMEIYMGNVLTGKNADTPSPYDFAMGGGGLDPSLPVGADGSVIERGNSIMVDMNGNYTGYMTDMTRVFSVGPLPELAIRAHKCSLDICAEFRRCAVPGVKSSDLFTMATSIAEERGLSRYFMGYTQQAGFVGHGVGIEINELPVIAPRSKSLLEKGNVIALEPKFVIPGVGAVGIENTYVVTGSADGAECLTNAPEQIIDLS